MTIAEISTIGRRPYLSLKSETREILRRKNLILRSQRNTLLFSLAIADLLSMLVIVDNVIFEWAIILGIAIFSALISSVVILFMMDDKNVREESGKSK